MDHSKHILGTLCRKNHESAPGSGRSWRYVVHGRPTKCVLCSAEAKKRYVATPKGAAVAKQANAAYRVSDKGVARDSRSAERRSSPQGKQVTQQRNQKYAATSEGKKVRREAQDRYQKSERGRQVKRRYNRKYQRERRKHDEVFALVQRLRCRLGAALRLYSTTGKTQNADEYGVDYPAIVGHVGPCPGPRDEWHLDHVRPLASFDWNDPRTPRRAFSPENHQWLSTKDNLSKGSSWTPMEL